jgi:hypothetical protein
MNSEQEARLQTDVDRGQRAQHVYDTYFEDFIKRINEELFNSFLIVDPDPDYIMKLKYLQMAVSSLEGRIKSDIDGGKVALRQLSDAIKH